MYGGLATQLLEYVWCKSNYQLDEISLGFRVYITIMSWLKEFSK